MFLFKVLKYEFVIRDPIINRKTFDSLINYMQNMNVIKIENEKVLIVDKQLNKLYTSLIWPIVETHWSTVLYLLSLDT